MTFQLRRRYVAIDYIALAKKVCATLKKKGQLDPLPFDEALGFALVGIAKFLYEHNFVVEESPDGERQLYVWARTEVLNERQRLLTQQRSVWSEQELCEEVQREFESEDPYLKILREELLKLVFDSVVLSTKHKQLFLLLQTHHPRSDFNLLCKYLKVEPHSLKRLLEELEQFCREALR
jgi:hypothetical protein